MDDWVLCKLYKNRDDKEESESESEDEDEDDQGFQPLLDVGDNPEEHYPEYEEINVAPPIYSYDSNFVQGDYCANDIGTYFNNPLIHIENDQLLLDSQLAMDHDEQLQVVDYGIGQEQLQQPGDHLVNYNNNFEMGNLYAPDLLVAPQPTSMMNYNIYDWELQQPADNFMNYNNDFEMGNLFAPDLSVAQPDFNEVHPNNIVKLNHPSDQSMSLPQDYQNGYFKDPS